MAISQRHIRLLRQATSAALAVAVTLALAKAIAWWLSGSVSLLAGLTDSLLDGAASLINLLAVRYALRPADEDHRYGHGKAESLAGLGQAVFICLSAFLVGVQAVDRILHPEPIEAQGLGIAIMLISLLLTAALLLFQHKVVRETGSHAILADSLHYRSDLLLNSSILLALVLSLFGIAQVDAYFGLGISFYILYSAWTIAHQSLQVLMDAELPIEQSTQIEQLALGTDGVLGVHDLRTRISGRHWFIQLHLELPEHLSLREAQQCCEAVQSNIQRVFPHADVLLYPEPYGDSSGK